MKNKILSVFLKSAVIFLVSNVLISIQIYAQYPNVDKIYTRNELDSMIAYFQSEKDTLGLGYTYWAYAKNEENESSLNDSPITNFRKSMEYFYAAKQFDHYYNIKGAIGSFFMDRAFMKQLAKDYIESAVFYFRKKNNTINEAGHLINLANIYIHENNFEPVENILERVRFLNKSNKDIILEARVFSSYSDYYARRKDYKNAFLNIDKSYAIGKAEKVIWIQAVALYLKSTCYQSLKKEELRKESLLAALELVEKNTNLYQIRKEIFDNLRDYYYKKGNFEMAYQYAYKAQTTIENIYFSKNELDLRAFTEYNLLEEQKLKMATLDLQRKVSQNEVEKLKVERYIFIGIILFILLIFLLLIYSFINRRKIDILRKSEIEREIKIDSLNALISGQELERERIAKDLHDGLGIMLARMKFMVEQETEKSQTSKMIDDVCSEVRNISSNLQPTTLADFGLRKAIDNLVLKHNFSKPSIIFQYFGEHLDLGTNMNLMIYRIVQEVLANSIKHANANEILIQIVNTTESLTLTIEDDGIGFDEYLIKPESHGWKNIKSRVMFLQAELHIISGENCGTSVTIIMNHF